MPSHKVGMKLWIRKLQKGTETPLIVLGKALVDVFDEADQQHIKLPHAASTAPSEPRSLCVQWLVAPGRDQLLYFSDRLGGIEVLRARLSAIENRVTPIEPKGVLQRIETLARRLVATVYDPAVRLKQRRGTEVSV